MWNHILLRRINYSWKLTVFYKFSLSQLKVNCQHLFSKYNFNLIPRLYSLERASMHIVKMWYPDLNSIHHFPSSLSGWLDLRYLKILFCILCPNNLLLQVFLHSCVWPQHKCVHSYPATSSTVFCLMFFTTRLIHEKLSIFELQK